MDLTSETESDALEPDGRPALHACPVCKSRRLQYAFSRDSFRIARCADCQFLMVDPQPSDEELAILAGRQILPPSYLPGGPERSARRKSAAQRYLADIKRYRGVIAGALLQIGCGRGELLAVAEEIGYHVTGTETSAADVREAQLRLSRGNVVRGAIESLDLPQAEFNVAVLCDVIEQTRDPLALLRAVRQSLKTDGVLFLTTPALDAGAAPGPDNAKTQFNPQRLSYFDFNSIQNALFQSGFESVVIQPASAPGAEAEIAVFARPRAQTARPTLSIIVPATKDAAMLDALMKALLARQIPGVDVQIILVLSNPSPAIRDVASAYADHPRVGLVLEEIAYGKGHAIRAGLAQAAGEFVLIQDLDLGYDLEDLSALVLPLVEGREAVALAARRRAKLLPAPGRFSMQRWRSLFTDCGRWLAATLLNVAFDQDLQDPFASLKAFRRDCLTGINLHGNGGELHVELLLQLLRKGYRAIEVPVNYRPRPTGPTHKLQRSLDAWMCLAAMARVRFSHLDALAEIERRRQKPPAPSAPHQSPAKAA